MLLLLLIATSCDKNFFEYEGDCEVTHSVRFVYDMNLKWANAFPSEVKSVNLYVFDNNGLFVKEYQSRGNALTNPDFRIQLDLPANRTYKFLAWCGLENENADYESFKVVKPVAGITTIEEMDCILQSQATTDKGEEISDLRLQFLYHGYLEEYLEDNHDGTHYDYTISLTKDTNHIRVMLQQTTGSLSAKDFEFSLTAENGHLAWNNQPTGDTMIEYQPWNIGEDILGVGNSGDDVKEYYGVIADLSTCRLMAPKVNDIFLCVRKKEDQKLLFKVPIIQYSLSEKSYYEEAYGRKMTDQEFLDRQDEYTMTFFLGENLNWLYAVIEILEWRVVIRNYENQNQY